MGLILEKKKFFKKLIVLSAVSFLLCNSSFAAENQPPKLKPLVLPDNAVQKVSPSQPSKIEVKKESKNETKKKKFELYTDKNGNPISKEQKERIDQLKKTYKKVTKEERIMEALEVMKGGLADFSRRAIMGNNLTSEPIFIAFEDLSKFGQAYTNYDALGWKKKEKLYIYINKKHQDAPAPALAAVLAHEALHQDEFNSLNEETYAWTLEAAVWTQLSEKDPKYNDSIHPLVIRENTLKKLFIKGNYTNKFIKKTVFANPGYANLPSRSPGFEDDNL